jgi:hypothetical protein
MKWPNNQHWRFLDAAFHEIAGPSWRMTAAARGGVERKELRACVDRELTIDEIHNVDQFLIESLQSHIRDLDKRRNRATALIVDIEHAGYERAISTPAPSDIVDDDPRVFDARPFIEWYWRTFFAEETADDEPKLERTAA